MTLGAAIELLYKNLPYSEQIKNLDVGFKDVIRFTWRGNDLQFEYTNSIMVYQIKDSMLTGSDLAILIRKLLQNNLP